MALMMRTACLIISGLIAAISTSDAQQSAVVHAHSEIRTWGISGGYGTTYGGFGGAVDRYIAHSRLSVVVGGGYLPTTTNTGPGTGAVGAGIRGYTKGARHRALLELSVTFLYLTWTRSGNSFFNVHRHYGPGISGGYHFSATKGLSVLMTAGLGWVPDLGKLLPIGDIGFGYTWRR